jgi:ABC-2 type transport system permease protein
MNINRRSVDWIINRFLRPALGRAYVRIKGGNRELSWLLWEVILPMIMISSVIWAYENMGAPNIFKGFVILGGAMISYWYNVLWGMGRTLYWEKETGNLELFLLSDAPLPSLLFGMAIGGMFNTSIRSLAVIILGFIVFKAEFNIIHLPVALLIFFITLVALYGVGLALSGLHIIYGRMGVKINELLDEPIMFLSGQYYPISTFPLALQAIAGIIPLAIGLDGVRRALLMGEGIEVLWIHLILLTILMFIFYPLGLKILNKIVEKGKRDGRLILRWI